MSDAGVVVPGGGDVTMRELLRLREPLADLRRELLLSAPLRNLSLPLPLPVGVLWSSCVKD